MILAYDHYQPEINQSLYIAPSADIIGNVMLEEETTIWFNVTIRGDMAPIHIGKGTNIQDNTVVHVNTGMPTYIGNYVTVGHSAIIHACTIHDNSLIGMGAIILDEAVIGEECLVAAGALVSPRKQFPPRSLIVGSPARVIRTLTDEEVAGIRENTLGYIEKGRHYQKDNSSEGIFTEPRTPG
jgi:carbonic anhydrase/acetyltransferase-like protein (isoleucine patch superfamily)